VSRIDNKHSEGHCLMKYRTKSGKEEIIWNSRDGVTPFAIMIDGEEAIHVEWHLDRYVPDYTPKSGERIFVDMTREAAEKYAKVNAAKYWTQEAIRGTYSSEEEVVAVLTAEYLSREGAPDLVVVP
jgi:hypothetical protein